MIDIEAQCLRLDSYTALLARFWGFYAPLEARLATIDWGDAGIDYSPRAKLPLLSADLACLGYSAPHLKGLPQAVRLPRIESLAEAMGVLYVVEGSTLGGQTIVPLASKSLGIEGQSGARFFSSYGSEVGAMWRSFVVALEGFASPSEVAAAVERGALGAFDCLTDWMALTGASPWEAEGRRHVL